jgi:thiol:disulfide interchange protein
MFIVFMCLCFLMLVISVLGIFEIIRLVGVARHIKTLRESGRGGRAAVRRRWRR